MALTTYDDPDGLLQYEYTDADGGLMQFAVALDGVTVTAWRGLGRPSRYPDLLAPLMVDGAPVPNRYTPADGVTLPE